MKKFYAYSVVELIAVLFLLTILLLIAVPTWHNFGTRNRAMTEADHIVSALQFARLEAIKRGINVAFCRKAQGAPRFNDWSQGQIVRDVYGKTLRVFAAVPGQDKLLWNGSLGKDDCIIFTPMGITAGQNGDFVYCPQGQAENALAIIIQTVGVIHIASSLPNGDAILCD